MKKGIVIILIGLLLSNCGSKKRTVTRKKTPEKKEVIKPVNTKKKDTNVVSNPSKKITVFKSTEAYIDAFKDVAINEMRIYQIPASITLAQGILESGSGKGRLAVEANNHFGIKCHNWKGKKIYHDDDKAQECFRKYEDASFSYRDHSEFLANRKRYSELFLLDIDDYKGWAKELKRAGYATDKKYPQKLITLIERYNLTKYDAVVIGKKPKKRKQKVQSTHVVIKGDTLYSLSKRYNISVEKLKRINNLSGTDIKIGQVLNIQD